MDYSLDGSVERLSYFLRSNFIMGRASKKVLKSIDKKVLGKLVKEVRDEFERDHNFEEDLLDIHQLLNKVRRKDVDIGINSYKMALEMNQQYKANLVDLSRFKLTLEEKAFLVPKVRRSRDKQKKNEQPIVDSNEAKKYNNDAEDPEAVCEADESKDSHQGDDKDYESCLNL